MHELSLTQNILDTVLKHAGNGKIKNINLSIGELSDECEDSIRFYWDGLVEGTPIQDAELRFRQAQADMQCLDCGSIFHPEEETVVCPLCQSYRLTLLSGYDVKLESIDVE